MFSSVLTSYNNHWVLRTSPDDWWIVVVRRVAQAVDEHGDNERVRQFFVNHQGQKSINVNVPGFSLSNIDYSWLFNQFSSRVRDNINVPGYVDIIQADFSGTTDQQRIISQVMLMSSIKKFFAYSIGLTCGIPGVDMKGSDDDWSRLVTKLAELRNIITPVMKDLDLERWFDETNIVFSNLLNTFRGQPDNDWWGKILSWKSGGSGVRAHWEGWFPYFLGADAD